VNNAIDPETSEREKQTRFSFVALTLLKGVMLREDHEQRWSDLLARRSELRDYLAVLGLTLDIDEAEGFAVVRQAERDVNSNEPELPRLVTRRALSFSVSVLLVLLRKRLLEFDTHDGGRRLILKRSEIVALVQDFFRDTHNEAKLTDRVSTQIAKVQELGMLRQLKGSEHEFEVHRVLKAYVDGRWLADVEQRLQAYRAHAEASSAADDAKGNDP
jgi:hypothetical protein